MASPSDTLFDDPAFFHLTRTNEPPSPAEEAIFLGTIDQLQAQLVTANRSLMSLHGQKDLVTVRAIQADKKHISLAIQRRKTVLSVVRRLPAEILGHIFLYTTVFPGDSNKDGNTKWVLARVCKMWRACALTLPRLWSFVNIYNHSNHVTNFDISRLVVQLKLARCVPLSVSFSLYASPANAWLGKKVVELLLQYAPYICWMEVDLPPELMDILLPLRGNLGSLTHLDIVNAGMLPTAPCAVFDQCPQLRDVVTYAVPGPDEVFTMPWNTITHYTGHLGRYRFFGTTIDEAFYILSRSPRMAEAVFPLTAPRVGRLHPIQCPDLRSLFLYDTDRIESPDFRQLCDQLNLPVLYDLAILLHSNVSTERMMDARVFTSLVDLVERSRSPLNRIAYQNGFILPVDVNRLLRVAAPTLRIFVAYGTHVTNETVREMFSVDSRLYHVTLTGCLQFDPYLFLQMLRARWQVRPLYRLELGWIPSPLLSYEMAEEALKVVSAGVEEMRAYDMAMVFVGKILESSSIC